MVCINRMLIAHLAIDRYAATNGVAVALRHHVRGHRGKRRDELERPRQRRAINTLRLSIRVQIVDVGDCPRRTVDLLQHPFGVELNDRIGVANIRTVHVRAEDPM